MLAIQERVPLAPFTTFEIGGIAEFFVDVHSEDEILEAIRYAKDRGLNFTILSGGSNVLMPDEGIGGLVIHIGGGSHSFAGVELIADAGCDLLQLIREAARRGLGGWEKLAGIPGTIGGAVRGNAGAFGTEIKDLVTKVYAIDSETGEMREFVNDVCDFSYRHSFFKDNPEWIITRVYLKLVPSSKDELHLRIEDTIAEREKRHLQDVRAAGSFFMNPIAPQNVVDMFEKEKGVRSREHRVPAGWLIEKAGMKGATVGGAIASLQHPNYIVNENNATAEDVRNLAEKIKAAVKEKFGVELKEEAALL